MNASPPPEKKTRWQGYKQYMPLMTAILIVVLVSIVLIYLVFNFGTVLDSINTLLGYVMPVLYGIFMALLLNPLYNFFRRIYAKLFQRSKRKKTRERADKHSRRLGIATAVILFLLIIVGVVLMLIPALYSSALDLADKFPSLLSSLQSSVQSWTDNLLPAGSDAAEGLRAFLAKTIETVQTYINDNINPTINAAVSVITSSVVSVFLFLFNFFVGVVVAIYTLSDKEKFAGGIKRLTYAFFRPQTANNIIDTARYGYRTFVSFINGRLIDSLIVGILCFLFCVISGMPYALLLSVVIGITNIIPFFGPFIGGIPSALLVLMIDPVKGIVFAIFIIILQQVDGNIIGPKVLGNKTGLSEFWVTFALLFFGGMFGFIGMILGVPLFAVLYYMGKRFTMRRMAKKSYPVDDEYYRDVEKYDIEAKAFVRTLPATSPGDGYCIRIAAWFVRVCHAIGRQIRKIISYFKKRNERKKK